MRTGNQAESPTAEHVRWRPICVMAGAGPAVLSDLAVKDDVAAGRLVRVPVSGMDHSRSLRAVWLSARRPTGAAEDLLRLALPQARRTGRPPGTGARGH